MSAYNINKIELPNGDICDISPTWENIKSKPTISSPNPNGTDISFIDTIAQTNGTISATKKTVPTATTSENGLMLSSDKEKLDDIDLIKQVKTINIEPVQDLHGYENPWPAGGGKNLFNASASSGSSNGVTYTKNENGTYTVNGTANGTSSFVAGPIDLVANTQYILSGCPSDGSGTTYNVRIRDSSYVALGFDVGTGAIITPTETKTYYCQITLSSGTSVSNLVFKPMIRLASITDDTFAPYSNICPISGWTGANVVVSPTTDAQDGTTYPISWETEAGTVYGGTLDVVSGELVVDRVSETKKWGDLGAVTDLGTNERRGFALANVPKFTLQSARDDLKCNMVSVYNVAYSLDEIHMYIANNDYVWIYLPDTTDSNADIQLLYSVATPQTYQLTPTQILLLAEHKHVWADCGDITLQACFTNNAANVTGIIAVEHGGTGATSATDAWAALGGGASGKHADSYFVKSITSTDNAIARFDGISGQVQNSGVTIDDNNNITATKFIGPLEGNVTGNVSGSAGSVALSGVTGADNLKAIEALSETSGFLKKTAGTWSLDTNTYLTSSTGVTSIAGKTGAITLADLGLSQALRFIGITSTGLSDGATTSTLAEKSSGSLIKTTGFITGDVVIDTNSAYEYVWTGSAWERLGGDSSYKTTQTAKSDPQASNETSTTFIDTISQDANGVITATKKTLPSYVPTSAGVTAVTWDSTNNKLTRTINGSAADVVTIATIKTALALTKSDVGLGNVANSTYAGGTAVTLNNSSKASSTASFYAPTTGGTANTQALVGNGATTAPKWVDISPSITIGAGTGSAAPTVNVTVLGQSGTAKSITTASTSVYGVTKLNDGISSNSTTLAATANSALIAAKKVASSNTASKLYLVGATSQSTTGVDSYSYQYTYTDNGLLSALKVGLNLNGTEKAHLEWNNTDQSIDFIFE